MPALMRMSRSPASTEPRWRQRSAASSASRRAERDSGDSVGVAVAADLSTTPITLHQFVHLEQDDPDLEAGSQGEQEDPLARLDTSLLQIAVEGDEVRRRGRVPELLDVVDDVFGHGTEPFGELGHALADGPGRRLV